MAPPNDSAAATPAPEAATPEPGRTVTGISVSTFVLGLLVSTAVGAAASYWFTLRSTARLLQVMATPIAVVDFNQVVHDASADSSISGDRGREGLRRAQAAAERLSNEGYIVLDANAVLAAPPQYYASGVLAVSQVVKGAGASAADEGR